MADPNWIKRTTVLSLMLAAPSLILLIRTWQAQAQRPDTSSKRSLALWPGFVFLATFLCWFVNVLFEWSTSMMVGWPLFGILVSLFGCGFTFAATSEDRLKLVVANSLLPVLSLSSIIAPN